MSSRVSYSPEVRPFQGIARSSKQQSEPRGNEGKGRKERIDQVKERVLEKREHSYDDKYSSRHRYLSPERSAKSSRSGRDSRQKNEPRGNEGKDRKERVDQVKERVLEKRHSSDGKYETRHAFSSERSDKSSYKSSRDDRESRDHRHKYSSTSSGQRAERYHDKPLERGREESSTGGQRSSIRLKSYNMQISAAVRKRNINEALQVLESLPRDLEPDAYTFNPLLNYYAKNDDIQGLEKVYKKMQTAKVKPTVVTYNTLINGYLKAGKLDEAKDLLTKMQKDQLQPNVVP